MAFLSLYENMFMFLYKLENFLYFWQAFKKLNTIWQKL